MVVTVRDLGMPVVQKAISQYAKPLIAKGFTVEAVAADEFGLIAGGLPAPIDPSITAAIGYSYADSIRYTVKKLANDMPPTLWLSDDIRVTEANPRISRLRGRFDKAIQAGAKFIQSVFKANSIFLLYQEKYQPVAEQFEKEAAQAGLTIKASQPIARSTEDQNKVAAATAAANPDLVYIVMDNLYDVKFIDQLEAKWPNRKGQILLQINSSESLTDKIVPQAKDFNKIVRANMSYIQTMPPYLVGTTPEEKAINTAFQGKAGFIGLEAWVATQIVLDALDRTTTQGGNLPTREVLAEAIRATKLNTTLGPVSFDENGEWIEAPYYLMRPKTMKDDNSIWYEQVSMIKLNGNAEPVAAQSTPASDPAPTAVAAQPQPTQAQQSPASGPQLLQAEGDSVTRSGDWAVQKSASANGGAYIYGTSGDVQLSITGTQFDVVYVQFTSFGTLGVDVDGKQVKTVNAKGPQQFNKRLTISGLAPGTHQVRIYPVSGTVGLDAVSASGK